MIRNLHDKCPQLDKYKTQYTGIAKEEKSRGCIHTHIQLLTLHRHTDLSISTIVHTPQHLWGADREHHSHHQFLKIWTRKENQDSLCYKQCKNISWLPKQRCCVWETCGAKLHPAPQIDGLADRCCYTSHTISTSQGHHHHHHHIPSCPCMLRSLLITWQNSDFLACRTSLQLYILLSQQKRKPGEKKIIKKVHIDGQNNKAMWLAVQSCSSLNRQLERTLPHG